MVQEVKIYKTKDLVLRVSKTYNPNILDLDAWEDFLDILTESRNYQKEAIRNSIIFLASQKYKSSKDLIAENWKDPRNVEVKNRYRSLEEYQRHLQLPNKLSANIDLATGTGKSYVMYGIAQIMLGLGLVDRVLVLCPSLTIEKELTAKFSNLSGSSHLRKTIPEQAVWPNPRIIDAMSTIKPGDICIENIHAVYENTGSSIHDSLMSYEKGTVLVLNDEAHHIFNPISGVGNERKNIKKWKDFLLNKDYNFRYILGFTGTAYVNDEYFNDVIYRYSLRQAIDDGMVKMVDYVSRDDSTNDFEKFQKIYDNHRQNKDLYRRIKPLTILITKDIKNARRLTEELKDFLEKKEDLPREQIDKKIITVTSHKDHKHNVAKLPLVDDKNDPTEWIVSVSMLTEGWDVKNVFQIVPWEDRAFNSKLLIAQVLGRGLRVPLEYQSPQPKVIVFNHDAWSRKIKGLVDEILEIEMRLVSSVKKAGERAEYNFDIYNINYEKTQHKKDVSKEHQSFDYTKGYIELVAQTEESEKETEYIDISGNTREKNTLIHYDTFTVNEVVNKIYEELKIRKWEGTILKLPEGDYTKENLPSKDEIRRIVQNSMDRAGIKGNRLRDFNRQKILNSFNTLARRFSKTIQYVREAREPYIISTQSMDKETLAVGNLRQTSTVFYTEDYAEDVDTEVADILQAVIEDESFLKSSSKEINPYHFKTPLDLVFTRAKPEKTFVEMLCRKPNAKEISAWIKSRDQNFYSIEYTLYSVAGKRSKQRTFNPDFFIKLIKDDWEFILVVEIKADNDVSPENKAKLRYAKEHFRNLNAELIKGKIKQNYRFLFLSPNSYDAFFSYLREGKLFNKDIEFTSDLESLLHAENGS